MTQQVNNVLTSPFKDYTRVIAFAGPTITSLVILVLWHGIVAAGIVSKLVLPEPRAVVRTFVSSWRDLFWHGLYTSAEALSGLVIGSFLGGILAVIIVDSELSKRTVYPLAMASNAIPIVAISPALILALGDGMAPKICVTAFLVFFPMLVNGLRGLQSVDTQVGELMFTFSATRWQRLRLVRLPASLPFVFSALRLSACACFVAAIVSEWVSADRGLGYLIVYESSQYNTAKVWAAVITGTMLSMVVYCSVVLAERCIMPFRR